MFEAIQAQIAALATQIDAMVTQLEAMAGVTEALARTVNLLREEWPLPTEPICPHLETEDRSTFGHPNVVCKRCGQQVGQA